MSSESKILTDYFFGNGDVAYDSDEVSRLVVPIRPLLG
jgi:hypothetical protein